MTCLVCRTETHLQCPDCSAPMCSTACHIASTRTGTHCTESLMSAPGAHRREGGGGSDVTGRYRMKLFTALPRMLVDNAETRRRLLEEIQHMGDVAMRAVDIGSQLAAQLPTAIYREEVAANDSESARLAAQNEQYTDLETYMSESWWDAPLSKQRAVLLRMLTRLLKARYYKLEFPNRDDGPVFDILRQRRLVGGSGGMSPGGRSAPDSPVRSEPPAPAAAAAAGRSANDYVEDAEDVEDDDFSGQDADGSDSSDNDGGSGSSSSSVSQRPMRKAKARAVPSSPLKRSSARGAAELASKRLAGQAPARSLLPSPLSEAAQVAERADAARLAASVNKTERPRRRVDDHTDSQTVWSDYLLNNASNISSLESLIVDVQERLRDVDIAIKTQSAETAVSDSELVGAYLEWRHVQRTLWKALSAGGGGGGGSGDLLIGQEEVRGKLMVRVVMPLQMNAAAGLMQVTPDNVLLYGPGGVGKTALARATAAQLNLPLFEVSASDIQSSYQAESKINFATLMRAAQCAAEGTGKLHGARRGTVVFMDEADVLLVRDPMLADTSIVSEFKMRVQQQQQAPSSSDRSASAPIVFMAATNFPWDITDDAIKRRFPLKLYVGLPSAYERALLVLQTLTPVYTANVVEARFGQGRPTWTPEHAQQSGVHPLPTQIIDPDPLTSGSGAFQRLATATKGMAQGEIVAAIGSVLSREMAVRLRGTRFLAQSNGTAVVYVEQQQQQQLAAALDASVRYLSMSEVNDEVLQKQLQGYTVQIRLSPIGLDDLVAELQHAPRNIRRQSMLKYLQYAQQTGDELTVQRVQLDLSQFTPSSSAAAASAMSE